MIYPSYPVSHHASRLVVPLTHQPIRPSGSDVGPVLLHLKDINGRIAARRRQWLLVQPRQCVLLGHVQHILCVRVCVCVCVCVCVYLSMYLSIHLSIDLSIHLSIYPSIYISIYPSIYIYLSIYILIVII